MQIRGFFMRHTLAILALAVGLTPFTRMSSPPLSAAEALYAAAGQVPIGGAARFDYLAVDSAAKRLYVTHGTEVVVIDTATQKVVGRIADTNGVHGIALADGRGYVTAGAENKVAIVDLKTLQTLSKVDTGANPDAIVYEPGRKEIYSLNHTGKSVTVIDAASGKVTATIPLAGVAESGAADPGLGRVYVNVEDKNSVAVIDTKTHTVIANWSVAPAEEPTGMAIDTVRHRVFVGGGPSQVMLDGATGKVVASVKICDGTDATMFDAGASLSMSSCSDGHITIVRVGPGDTMTVAQTLETSRGARTMTLDPATHKIYTAAATLGPPAAAGGRPVPVPDSFRVLVYAPTK
jgi:YVTN family beta-propeller protein